MLLGFVLSLAFFLSWHSPATCGSFSFELLKGARGDLFMNRALILLAVAGSIALAQTPCEQLQSLKLPDTTITKVMAVPAGAFVNPAPPPAPQPDAIDPPPPPPPANATPQMLPAYCRLFATLKPSADSDIKVE